MVDISTDTAIANLTSALAASLANRFSRIANVVDDFGAIGNGTNNDTVALQTAINSCAGKAILLFPAGYTFNVSGLTVPSDSHFVIEGTIFLISHSNGPVVTLLGSNYLIEGAGIIDGNMSNNVYGGLGAAGIMTNTGGTTPPSLPFINIVIRNITIQHCADWPVSINSASNVLIEGTTLQNSGSAPQCAYGSQYVRFVNNCVLNNPDYGWAFYQGCSYGVCSNNIFNNVAATGLLNDGTPTGGWNGVPQHDIIVSNNVISNIASYGVAVFNGSGNTSANFYNVHVYGNHIINSGIGGGFTCGILLEQMSDSVIENNIIRGGGTSGDVWQGIVANGGVSACVIRNNTISNGGQNGATSGYGISAGFVNSIISNNHFYDDQATPTLDYAFAGPLSPTTAYLWNTFEGLKSGVFTAAPGSSINFVGQSALGSNALTVNPAVTFSSAVTFLNSVSGKTTGYQNVGLTIGYNQSNGYNEVDFLLGAGTLGNIRGGAHWYQLDDSGAIINGLFEAGAIMQTDGLGNFGALSIQVGSSNGPTWTSGAGAPTSVQQVGSLYCNTTGSTGSRLYISTGFDGIWNAVPGV
jgi:hypothetical protein